MQGIRPAQPGIFVVQGSLQLCSGSETELSGGCYRFVWGRCCILGWGGLVQRSTVVSGSGQRRLGALTGESVSWNLDQPRAFLGRGAEGVVIDPLLNGLEAVADAGLGAGAQADVAGAFAEQTPLAEGLRAYTEPFGGLACR
jgi:hypothetical protein